jgi:alkylation response protein AidB-like acyl-CoA dehydrogenase
VDFELSEEQAELCRSVRAVLERECPVSLVRRIVEEGATPEQPWKSAGELGWPAIHVPERLGGLGLGFEALGLVAEEHGRHLAPGPFLASATQFLPLVLEAGSPAQQERFVPPVAAGERTGALAVAGPTGRGIAPDGALRARRDGAGWVLEGSRHFVLDGDAADEVALVARVEEGDGVGLFVLPREALKAERVVGLDASRPLAHLSCPAVRVGPERALGTPGRSAAALARALEQATVALALEMVGTCQRLLELSVEYAKHREQFDAPIGSFQAVQHKCTDMFTAVEKARATGYFAMMAIAEEDPRRALSASMAKAAAGACQRRVAKEAIQIHGGTGYTWECDVQLFAKRVMTCEALLGSAADHRARIADLLQL